MTQRPCWKFWAATTTGGAQFWVVGMLGPCAYTIFPGIANIFPKKAANDPIGPV